MDVAKASDDVLYLFPIKALSKLEIEGNFLNPHPLHYSSTVLKGAG